MNNKVFKNKPIRMMDDIPVFSENDEYIVNYENISMDHLSSIQEDNKNPFIEEELWCELEDSTIGLLNKCLSNIVETKDNPIQPIRILDVGVGLGRLLTKFQENSNVKMELWGIDISSSYLKIAKKEGINVASSKIEDMPFIDDYFDLIVCTDVLEHVFDLNFCIHKILSVLKPGGEFVIRVPNKENLTLYLKPDYPYPFVHLRNFDKESLELLFTKVFKCAFKESNGSGYVLNIPMLKYYLPIKGYNFILRNIFKLINLSCGE